MREDTVNFIFFESYEILKYKTIKLSLLFFVKIFIIAQPVSKNSNLSIRSFLFIFCVLALFSICI
jgi:hypothetical protein